MTVCNFCNKSESHSRTFSDVYVCKECYDKPENYDFDRNGITFVDNSNKRYEISSDTEINIINSGIPGSVPINVDDYKDALFASLYTQVDFLNVFIV